VPGYIHFVPTGRKKYAALGVSPALFKKPPRRRRSRASIESSLNLWSAAGGLDAVRATQAVKTCFALTGLNFALLCNPGFQSSLRSLFHPGLCYVALLAL
jgi:hypothetical protein